MCALHIFVLSINICMYTERKIKYFVLFELDFSLGMKILKSRISILIQVLYFKVKIF